MNTKIKLFYLWLKKMNQHFYHCRNVDKYTLFLWWSMATSRTAEILFNSTKTLIFTTSKITLVDKLQHVIYAIAFLYHQANKMAKFNSLRPCSTLPHQWIGLSLVQVKACHLFGTKPLPEPTLTYCQLGHQEKNSKKFEIKYKKIIFQNSFINVSKM